MGKGNPWEGGLRGKGADLKAWRRWLDNKGDFLVTGSRDTKEEGARPGEPSSLSPQGRPASLPMKCEREDRGVGRGHSEPISPRGTSSRAVQWWGEGRQGKRASEAGDPWLVTHMMPFPSTRHQPTEPLKGLGQLDFLTVQQGKLRTREVE